MIIDSIQTSTDQFNVETFGPLPTLSNDLIIVRIVCHRLHIFKAIIAVNAYDVMQGIASADINFFAFLQTFRASE